MYYKQHFWQALYFSTHTAYIYPTPPLFTFPLIFNSFTLTIICQFFLLWIMVFLSYIAFQGFWISRWNMKPAIQVLQVTGTLCQNQCYLCQFQWKLIAKTSFISNQSKLPIDFQTTIGKLHKSSNNVKELIKYLCTE